MNNNLEMLDETLKICKNGYYVQNKRTKNLALFIKDMEESIVLRYINKIVTFWIRVSKKADKRL